MDEPDKAWHLDRRIPIVFIGAVVVQTVAISWWAAALSTRVDALERGQVTAGTQAERLIRVEEKIGVLQQNVTEIRTIVTQQQQQERRPAR